MNRYLLLKYIQKIVTNKKNYNIFFLIFKQPLHFKAYNYIASIHNKLNNFEKYNRMMLKLIQIFPKICISYDNLAFSYNLNKQYIEAQFYANESISINKNF